METVCTHNGVTHPAHALTPHKTSDQCHFNVALIDNSSAEGANYGTGAQKRICGQTPNKNIANGPKSVLLLI